MRKIFTILLIHVFLFSTFAQSTIDLFDISTPTSTEGSTLSDVPVSADYIIGENNEIYITVNIWGEVKKTGYFKVPSTTDLMTLLSIAGGPRENANIGAIKIVRVNKDEGEEGIIYINLEEYLETGNYDLVPILKPGDTVIVPGNFMSYFTNFVNIVAKVALIVNVYYSVSRLND